MLSGGSLNFGILREPSGTGWEEMLEAAAEHWLDTVSVTAASDKGDWIDADTTPDETALKKSYTAAERHMMKRWLKKDEDLAASLVKDYVEKYRP